MAELYFDYAATTPVDPRVAEYMADLLGTAGPHANPASDHAAGRRAAAVVDQARERVAAAVGAWPEEIIWTSGATEANNLALHGVAGFQRRRGRACHVIVSAVEHASLLEPLEALERRGVNVTRLPVSADGLVDRERLEAALRPETGLVSIMHVNNETGVAQDLAALGEAVRRHGALFHVDAAQSVGRLPLDVNALPVDLVSLSAHKLYGPKGVGALYLRSGRRLEPLLRGGGQERGLRSGTLATHQAAGMGLAFELSASCGEEPARLAALSARLRAALGRLEDVFLIGHEQQRSPHVLSLAFAGVHGRALQALTPALAASIGSACNAPTGRPSHVLRAMGIPDALAQSVLRLSLGRFTTEPEIDAAVECLTGAVDHLRRMSPLWHDRLAGMSWTDIYGVEHLPRAA